MDERPFTVAELMAADEVLVSSSSKFCLSACEVDGKPVGGRAAALLETIDPSVVFDYIRTTQQECISALSRLL